MLLISVKMAEAMSAADFLQLVNIGKLPLKGARCANKGGFTTNSRQPLECAVHGYIAMMFCQGSKKPNLHILEKIIDE